MRGSAFARCRAPGRHRFSGSGVSRRRNARGAIEGGSAAAGVERLLHVQHMLCRHLDQTAAVSPERANSTNEARRTEAGPQQTHRMEVLKPLAVGYVRFPAGNILYLL